MIEPNDLRKIEVILSRCELIDSDETKLLEKIKLLNEEIKLHEEYIEKSKAIKEKVFKLDGVEEVKKNEEEELEVEHDQEENTD